MLPPDAGKNTPYTSMRRHPASFTGLANDAVRVWPASSKVVESALRVMRSFPVRRVARALSVVKDVPSGRVRDTDSTPSPASVIPSQVMRVSVAPRMLLSPAALALGRAEHFDVSRACAFAGSASITMAAMNAVHSAANSRREDLVSLAVVFMGLIFL